MRLRSVIAWLILATVSWTLGLVGCAASPKPVDEEQATGFAIYRSGQLDAKEISHLCDLGVREIVVMDGGALRNECRLRSEICPDLKVRYNHPQDAYTPVSRDFLAAFDAWVEDSRAKGRKISFRCRHGWHRAGRLSAYYRMRFNGWTQDAAIEEMLEMGQYMDSHPQLRPQVAAMADQLAERPCSQSPEHCPRDSPADAEGLFRSGHEVVFAEDLCSDSVRSGETP
jgi:hypothetical protein